MRLITGKIVVAAALSLSIGMAAGDAPATPITIASGSGDETCNGGACFAIAPHGAWAANDPLFLGNPTDAIWISYAQTGITPPSQAAVSPSETVPRMIYQLTFDADPGSAITTKVWADDTAQIFVDGFALNTPDTLLAHNSTCQNPNAQTPSCVTGEQYVGTVGNFFSDHILEIRVYQIGTGATNDVNPFGLMYAGQIEATDVSEPASLLLFGPVVAGAVLLRRRRKKRSRRRQYAWA
jgi:hypothetical protein